LAWGVTAAAVTVWAAAGVVASGEWPGVLAVACMLASCGGILAFTVCEDRPDRWRWTAWASWWTGAAAVAWGSLVTTQGGAGSLIVLPFVVTCPVLLAHVRRLLLGWSLRRASGPPETLGRRELLRRWEWTTCEVLRDATPVERRLALVEQRRALLDELERRDPAHFDEWVVTAVPDRAPLRQRHRRA
jgi:hypothetical protein